MGKCSERRAIWPAAHSSAPRPGGCRRLAPAQRWLGFGNHGRAREYALHTLGPQRQRLASAIANAERPSGDVATGRREHPPGGGGGPAAVASLHLPPPCLPAHRKRGWPFWTGTLGSGVVWRKARPAEGQTYCYAEQVRAKELRPHLSPKLGSLSQTLREPPAPSRALIL